MSSQSDNNGISESIGAQSDSSSGEALPADQSARSAQQALTADDVSRIVNAAISQRMKAFPKPVQAPEKLEADQRIALLEAKLAEAEKRTEQATLTQSVFDALAKAEITDPSAQDLAANALRGKGLIEMQDGQPVFITSEGPVPLAYGIKQWADSTPRLKDAKKVIGSGQTMIRSEQPQISKPISAATALRATIK